MNMKTSKHYAYCQQMSLLKNSTVYHKLNVHLCSAQTNLKDSKVCGCFVFLNYSWKNFSYTLLSTLAPGYATA